MDKQNNKIPVGILGATGMVGQKLIMLLEDHPWFEVACVAASKNSAGRSYKEALGKRWAQEGDIPYKTASLQVYNVAEDVRIIKNTVSFVFSAISAEKENIRDIEESFASAGIPVVSNNSAHRWTSDVPMIIPEINPHHLDIIPIQQKNRNWNRGFIITKPNCSIQSYVPLIKAWEKFRPDKVIVSTYQAISGAGKTFDTWPEMRDNVIPYIAGEEEKSELEPGKILGDIINGNFSPSTSVIISASCLRVPVSDGHMAAINIKFKEEVTKEQLTDALENYVNPLKGLDLPSAPDRFITYFEKEDRPQTYIDRELSGGMGISAGRLRKDTVLGWKCVGLSHNTLRGAAGGSILNAELLYRKGLINQ